MDAGGEPPPLKDSLSHNSLSERDPNRYAIQVAKLRPEELQMYKECSGSMYYRAGIPFAVLCQVLSSVFFPSVKAEPTPQRYFRRGFIFFGNMFLGTFLLGGPYCYKKLLKMHQEYENKNKHLDVQVPVVAEGVPSETQAEDFSYPTALAGSFNEPESNFSSDFNFSRLITDDDDKSKTPFTSYQELRMKNRNSQNRSTTRETSPIVTEPEFGLSGASAPIEHPVSSEAPPPRKVVKRNKYGDEIE